MTEPAEHEYPPAICPVCESTNVITESVAGKRFKCKKCGYEADRDLFWTRSNE